MTVDVILTCLLIFFARIADVSLGTIRTVAVIHGRRFVSWALGFFEVLVWILIVAKVIRTVDENPLYPMAYALGFATGNFVGITIETYLAYGQQVARIFTRRAAPLEAGLREDGYRVTSFDGRGRDGPVTMLFIETRRRSIRTLVERARGLDPECYYVIDDVRLASTALAEGRPGGLLSVIKRK